MIDAPMSITVRLVQPIVGYVLIGKDRGLRQDALFGDSVQRFSRGIVSGESQDSALALDYSDNALLFQVAAARATALALPFPAHVGLIHLDRGTLQSQIVFRKQRTNLFEHAPSRLVGHASFPLN